ncbi:dsDNA nuclease domain-containing protein [Streptomyces sp. NPDC091273]|uniref:dsDNA nuclease domain-containing protein n=1 Tax=Streptomyces sp. NPDC091273 TaxID=3365982 RepID=UPI0037FDCD6A
MCIALLTQDSVESVVCEWHEDFVVSHTDGLAELVSVKHRGKRRNPWNVADFCKDGGLAHLFDRWCACDGLSNVRLRLATNAGLATGKVSATALKAMCGGDPRTTAGVDDMAKAVAQYLLRVVADAGRRSPATVLAPRAVRSWRSAALRYSIVASVSDVISASSRADGLTWLRHRSHQRRQAPAPLRRRAAACARGP